MDSRPAPDAPDAATAQAFATSWNNLAPGSVYTREQVLDWFSPLAPADFRGRRVLELGCGSASLLVHVLDFEPLEALGLDLGASVLAARRNLAATGHANWHIVQDDLCTFRSDGYDLVYCIGVLHHLQDPRAGFASVVANTRPGGRFHCWVYGREGNLLIRLLVDPLRRVCSRLPWWLTKYGIATPLAGLYYLYAKALAVLPEALAARFPLGPYSCWIAKREFGFFRHVAFDQLVTPQTAYLPRHELERWLTGHPEVVPGSWYILQRNGNSWKFGGTRTGPTP